MKNQKIKWILGVLFFLLFQQQLFANSAGNKWTEIYGKWQFEEQSIKPLINPNSTFPEFGVVSIGLTNESIWNSTSIDFQYSEAGVLTQFGFLLNVVNQNEFQLLRLINLNKIPVIQLLRWQYGHFRKWQEIKIPTSLSTNTNYKLTIEQSPMVDKEDWKMWKIILTDLKTNEIILKKGVDNEQPAFGLGRVGLYTNNLGVIFQNFKVESARTSTGKLKLATLFSDGMVFQRNKTLCVWGIANPKEQINVSLLGQNYKTQSDDNGNWRIYLPAMKAQVGLTLNVKTEKESISIKDIAVGEVWLASGQSNMAMRAWQSDVAKTALDFTQNTNVRFFLQPQWPSSRPCFDSGGKWMNSDSENGLGLSAVALSFAIELQKKLHVTVGVIASHWGGTSIESWIPRQELATDSFTLPILNRYNRAQTALEKGEPTETKFRYAWDIPGQHHTPGDLYNGMIAPHTQFALNGVIWYQGESNSNRAKQYEHLLPMLISSWRKAWNNKALNFYLVQLAGYDGKQSGSEIVDAWPHLRESQRLTLNKFSDIGMVVATDLGSQTNIHPARKLEIGNRLSRLALYDVYGFRDIVRSSPLFKSVTYNKKNEAIVSFIETGDGLKALNNKPLTGFMIAGEDKQFVEAEATILPDGKSIKVYSPKVSSPVSVRYGWSNNPTDANLGNSANLPASPFRTDNWVLETDNEK